jgi:hypothetical protein
MKFDGVDDRLMVPSPAIGNWGSAGTVSLWFKPSRNYTSLTGRVDMQTKFYGPYIIYDYIDGKLSYVIYNNAGTEYSASKVMSLNANTWYHAVGVHTSSGIFIYVNGVLSDSQVADMTTPKSQTGQLGFGSQFDGSNYFFNGLIDDVKMWNRALSAQEIKQLYTQAGGKFNSSIATPNTNRGLVGWWTFDGNECGTTYCKDKSGNGKTASLTATTKVKGKMGQAMDFNGTTSAASASVVASAGYSFSVWGYAHALPAIRATIIAQGGNYNFDIDTNGKLTQFNGTAWRASARAITLNKWQHWVLTIDASGNMRYYIDGIKDSTAYTDGTTSVNGVSIGNTVGYIYNGLLDDVRVYNRVLTDQEVKQLYQMGK